MNADGYVSGQKDGPTETQVVSKDTHRVILRTDGGTKSSKGRYRANQSVTMMAVVNKHCVRGDVCARVALRFSGFSVRRHLKCLRVFWPYECR